MLEALFTGDGIGATAVHDGSACSSTRLLKALAGNKEGHSMKCIEGETRSGRGRVRGADRTSIRSSGIRDPVAASHQHEWR